MGPQGYRGQGGRPRAFAHRGTGAEGHGPSSGPVRERLAERFGARRQGAEGPGAGGPFGRGQGQGGLRGERPSPEDMRERAVGHIKEQLGVEDEEWDKLEPLVAAVVDQRAEGMRKRLTAARARLSRPEGQHGPTAEAAEEPAEVAALRGAIESEEATPEDLKAKIEAVREARAKKEAEIKAARASLAAALTPEQEAKLLLRGLID